MPWRRPPLEILLVADAPAAIDVCHLPCFPLSRIPKTAFSYHLNVMSLAAFALVVSREAR
ncbi:MAG TPA: hypothetical protein VFN11_02345 [Ktedonobacterales bacterium]|nr:hypothetical protein [Ktedonobacterales bacterium]